MSTRDFSKVAAQQGDDLKTFLSKLIERVPGFHTAIISDREGVTIIRVSNLSERDDELSLAVTFASASDYASKLKLGRNRTVTSFQEERVLFQVNDFPLLLTFIGNDDANVGLLNEALPELRKVMAPLRKTIAETDKELIL